jgi:hypothetical protein
VSAELVPYDDLIPTSDEAQLIPGSFHAAVAVDFRASSWRLRLALLGMVGWLAYEWGLGNETVTPWLIAHVISQTSGVGSIMMAALVGATFTTVQQLASGFTALAGTSLFERTSGAAAARLRRRSARAPAEWRSLTWTGRCTLVFALGTTAVALLQVAATGQVGVRRHGSVVAQSALLCGCLVGVVGGMAATIALAGRNVEGLSVGTHWLLRILGNPLFWIGLLAVVAIVKSVRRHGHARPAAAT